MRKIISFVFHPFTLFMFYSLEFNVAPESTSLTNPNWLPKGTNRVQLEPHFHALILCAFFTEYLICVFELLLCFQGMMFLSLVCCGLLCYSKHTVSIPHYRNHMLYRCIYIWVIGSVYGTALLAIGGFFTIAFCTLNILSDN